MNKPDDATDEEWKWWNTSRRCPVCKRSFRRTYDGGEYCHGNGCPQSPVPEAKEE